MYKYNSVSGLATMIEAHNKEDGAQLDFRDYFTVQSNVSNTFFYGLNTKEATPCIVEFHEQNHAAVETQCSFKLVRRTPASSTFAEPKSSMQVQSMVNFCDKHIFVLRERTVQYYDLMLDKWKTAPELAVQRMRPSACIVASTWIYTFCGDGPAENDY